jgi:hypothetical protein
VDMTTGVSNDAGTRALGSHLAKFVRKHPGPRYSQAVVQSAARLLSPFLSPFVKTYSFSPGQLNITSCLNYSLPQNLMKLLKILLPGLPSPTTARLRTAVDGVCLYALVMSSLELIVKDAAYQEESQAAAGAVQELRTLLQEPGPDGAPGEQL